MQKRYTDFIKRLNCIAEKVGAIGQTILVIDDCRDELYIVSKQLQKNGFKYILCESGEEATEALMTGVALVISDLNMPKMDGVKVAEVMKNNNIPCLITSNYSKGSDRVKRVLELGIPFMCKIDAEDQLISTIHSMIKSSVV